MRCLKKTAISGARELKNDGRLTGGSRLSMGSVTLNDIKTAPTYAFGDPVKGGKIVIEAI